MLNKTIVPLKMHEFEEPLKCHFEFVLQGAWRICTFYNKIKYDMFLQGLFYPYSNGRSLLHDIFVINQIFTSIKKIKVV